MAKKIELLHTTYDESGNIESQEVVHPLTSPDCIIMENGKTLDEVMGDGIATPTLTHEGTSFKVGVGDSNIEVVDGDVAGMTLKGQSYQNILPKPTTLIMETDEKEFKINDKIDSNIIIDDNIAEIATVKGKTIVNTVQEESGSEYTVLGEDLSGQSIVTTNKPEGNIKGVTLQGQTLVNTIQEPCKDDYVVLGADDGIEISAETGGHGTIENTAQGGINGAVLEGQTLVNTWKKHNTYTPYTFTLHDDGFMELNTPKPYFDHIQTDTSLLKPNTKYLLIIEAKNNTVPVNTSFSPDSRTVFSGNEETLLFAPKENGVRKVILTSISDFSTTENNMRWGVYITFGQEYIPENERGTITVRQMLIEYQDGMENWDIPYFEGMKSVQMPVLTTTGKNLFDGKLEYGMLNGSNGQLYETNNFVRTSNYIPVNSDKITYTIFNEECGLTVYFYDIENNFILHNSSSQTTYTFSVPSGAKYMKFRTYTTSDKLNQIITNNLNTQIQLEEGSTATPYEPYKSNILTVNEEVELRAIGDVKDELDLTTGKLTQRIGEVIFDGSEDWSFEHNGLRAYTEVSDLIRTDDYRGRIICDGDYIITSDHGGVTYYNHPILSGYYDGNNSYPYSNWIYVSIPNITSVEGLKQHFTENPLTIYYQLATESIKTVDLTVTDQDNNTIPHIQTQPTVTHITASSDYLIPTVTIDNNLAYDTIIKPSTLYTVRFNHDTVNADNPLTVDLGGTVQEVTSTEFTITTPSELTHNQLVFSGKNNVVSEVQVIEGDVTNIEYPFFEGMNDVKFSDSKFIGRGKNLVRHLSGSSYYGFTIQEAQGSSTIINGSLTTDYRDYYIVGTNENTHLIDYFNKMKVGETIHFSSNITGFAHHIAIGKPQQSNTYYCVDKYTKQSQDDVLLSMFIRFTKDCSFNNNELQIQVEIGSTATQYEPYKGVEVQQDVDSIPLTSDMFSNGYYDYNKIIKGMSMQQTPLGTDTNAIDRRIYSKSLIKVKPNSKYKIVGGLYGWFLFFDKNGNNIVKRGGSLGGVITNEFTTDSNTYYVGIALHKQDSGVVITPSDIPSDLALQEVPQEIVLRGIGDVKDELDLTRGEYIQRIGEVVLNGSEIWRDDSVNLYVKKGDFTSTIPTHLLNGRHIKDSGLNVLMGHNYVFLILKQDLPRGIEKTNVAWETYLQANPITVQYQLETPIIHKVNLTNTKVIPSYATETHYETITPSDSLIPNITIPSTLNYNVAIKPSTEYTIRANTSDNLTVDLGGTTGTLSNGKVTLTTPATLTHNEVKFSGTGKVKELMVVEGNEIKDNVPFFNGMKNVEMGGIKLVNIARLNKCSALVTTNANKTQFTYTSNGTTAYHAIYFDSSLLKTNTVYTVLADITTNTSDNVQPAKFQFGYASGNLLDLTKGFVGKIKQTITSANTTKDGLAIVFRPCSSGGKVVIENPMIIEGDWTHLDEIPYIESEMIIEQPIIRSQGKNLFDINGNYIQVGHTNTSYSISNNTITISGKWYLGQYLNLKPNTEYTLSWSVLENTPYNRAAIYINKTKEMVSFVHDKTEMTFTTPNSFDDIEVLFYASMSDSVENTVSYSNIQLELGNTATSYEPYKHQTLYSNRVIGYEDGCYYTWDTGTKASAESIASVMSDVEGLNVAYVTHASSNFSFYDKDGVYLSGSMFLSTATDLKADNNFDRFGFITIPANAKYMKMACGDANSAAAKDYYLKATVTGELPLRSLPNGVCDTLNLVTGEYVQRVGEIVLDGSEDWGLNNTNSKTTCYHLTKGSNSQLLSNMKFNTNSMLCNRYARIMQGAANLSNNEGIFALSSYDAIYIVSNIMSTNGTNDFKQYLSQNPITVQYELATPIVRKLGFTTKGNYREQVLDGSETIVMGSYDNKHYRMQGKVLEKPIIYSPIFTDDYHVRYYQTESHGDYSYISQIGETTYINILKNGEYNDTIGRQWLSQNPIKVGYITSTQSSESYSNIHKPIFFNNVDVQFLPNNLDIQPELTLQARTKNSYVMDMMKANTKYSVKLLSYSGNMTIDGTSYTLANNRTFISPSTLTNKELIISGQWYEPMIIEGDITGKNLPYFKGILSSYHDVDEVELYSVNKNLFDMSKVEPYNESGAHWWNTIIKENEVVSVRSGNIEAGQFGAYATLDVRPNSTYTLYIEMEKDGEPYNGQIYGYENDKVWGNGTFTGYANTPYHIKTSHNAKYITIGLNYGKDFPIGTTFVSKNMRLYLGEESPVYIPHAHNTTLIEMPTRLETVKVVRPMMENGAINTGNGANAEDTTNSYLRSDFIPVQPKEFIYFLNGNSDRVANIFCYNKDKNFMCYLYNSNDYVPENCYFVRIYMGKTNTSDLTMTRMAYKPIQLNSLPNGVRDEIIMKPNSNKAQLVQRVGKVVLDGCYYTFGAPAGEVQGNDVMCKYIPYTDGKNGGLCISDRFLTPTYSNQYTNIETIMFGTNTIIMSILRARTNSTSIEEYLKDNPITVYYELATPIIHEIQLKGYPYVYEDGTVTLNTDTPHQTLVSYNVNQEQLINTQNETIIRHDQQIDDLYYYIEMYLEEIYQMELFRMKLELSL